MIRPIQPLDIARYLLLGGPDRSSRAWTLDSLRRDKQPNLPARQAVRQSVLPHGRDVCSWTWTQGRQVVGIVTALPRSGRRSWEIAYLLLASDDDSGCVDLLNRLCQGVARKGGERVFIRLRSGDSVAGPARQCGFVPCAHEFLYRGLPRPVRKGRSASLREKIPSDDYNLFRLYNASTPYETRCAVGVTLDQWASSREQSRGRSHEFVYERDGLIRGWVKSVRSAGDGQLVMMVHPEEDSDAGSLMDRGLAELAGAKAIFCLVPEYQVRSQRLLWQRGYQVISEFDTLVRSMTVPVEQEKKRKAVTIAPT